MVLAIVACGAIAAAPESQPSLTQKLIQQIVKSTNSNADAAAKLVAAAKSLQDDPKVQVAMCEAAYEYGIKGAGGFGPAIEALAILDKLAPERVGLWAQKRLEAYRVVCSRGTAKDKQRYRRTLAKMLLKTGDEKSKQNNGAEAVGLYREALAIAKLLNLPEREEISQKLTAAVHQMQVQSAMDSLKAKLAANPGDKATRVSLIEVCLVALDSPAEAAKYLSDDCDESLRKYVPLAAKPLAELKEADCLELAKWYEQLIEKGTTQTSKANAAGRALGYYRHFLSVHKTKDAMGVGATLALKSLQERMKQLEPKLPSELGEAQWVDLLKLIDPARHVVSGKWVRQGGKLTCSCKKRGLITAPITALGSYDLQVGLTVKSGHEVMVILPVGAGHVALIIGGWKGQRSGLADIDGRGLDKGNPTAVKSKSKQGPLRIGAKAALDISVRIKGAMAKVAVALDGKKIISWSGKQSSLRVTQALPVLSRTFGLATFASKVVWHSVRVKRLDAFERNLKWVSKGATYKPSSIYVRKSKPHRPLGSFLSGQGKLHGKDYAFHTQKETNPHVVINLKKSQAIRRIIIENRRSEYWKNIQGLAVWVSSDGRAWKPVWRAAKAQRSWLIDLKTPVRAKYVKIGISGQGSASLSLAGVRILATGD